MSHSASQGRIGNLLGSGQQVAAVDETRRMRQKLVNKSRARSFISFGSVDTGEVVIQWIVSSFVDMTVQTRSFLGGQVSAGLGGVRRVLHLKFYYPGKTAYKIIDRNLHTVHLRGSLVLWDNIFITKSFICVVVPNTTRDNCNNQKNVSAADTLRNHVTTSNNCVVLAPGSPHHCQISRQTGCCP